MKHENGGTAIHGITGAGRAVIRLLKEAGIYQEYANELNVPAEERNRMKTNVQMVD